MVERGGPTVGARQRAGAFGPQPVYCAMNRFNFGLHPQDVRWAVAEAAGHMETRGPASLSTRPDLHRRRGSIAHDYPTQPITELA